MSAATRQRSCAACGAPVEADAPFELEPIVDDQIRFVVVHPHESCYPSQTEQEGR